MGRHRLHRPPSTGAATVAAALLVLGYAAPLRAQSRTADTIETLVADSDVVLVARLDGLFHADAGGQNTRPGARAVLHAKEVVKGDAPSALTLVVPSFYERQFAGWWRAGGGERLVFLVRTARAAWHPQGAHFPLALRTYAWTLTDPAEAPVLEVRRGEPVAGTVNVRITGTLSAGAAIAYTLDFHPIRTPDDARHAARAAARYGAERRASAGESQGSHYQLVRVPVNAPLLAGAARAATPQFLRIPLDGRAEAAARKWAVNPFRSEQAVSVLCHFKCDENAKLLAGLLDDALTVHDAAGGKGAGWRHYVRERAYHTLDRWGYHPRRPPIRGPDDFYLAPSAAHAALSAAIAVAVVAALMLLRRRRRGAASSSPDPHPPRRLLSPALLPLALVAALLWLDWRSRRTVHELTASLGNSRYWLSSYRGGLQFVRVGDWPHRRALGFGRFHLDRQAPAALWNQADVTPATDARFAGVRRLTGSMTTGARGTTYPYASATVPTAYLAAAAALPLEWHVLALLRDRRRRRLRSAKGCCRTCAYDLRGAPGTARCPECGTPAPLS